MSETSAKALRILIISDTHARDDVMVDVLREVGSFDILVHAGDLEGSDLLYEELVRTLPGTAYYSVAGNNDFFTDSPAVCEFGLPGISSSSAAPLRVFLTHGHLYHIDSGYEEICAEARRRGAQILICGHTHVPVASYAGKMGISAAGRQHRRPGLFRPRPSGFPDTEDLLVLNPGSLSYPRQKGKRPSYIILEAGPEGRLQYQIRFLHQSSDRQKNS